jgi:POT family proton-dependent oligopeptide transporter
LSFLKNRLANAVPGTTTLFFIQIFCTMGFAVLYSSLVLYATKHLHFPVKQAAVVMGVFGAFNYGLHLFGGYLGGRFMSNRNLFIVGMVLQVIGCSLISGGSVPLLYSGLAFFLTGSGLNVTCINMMLTQRFTPEDNRREHAFLWNYAGMNIGFFLGFTGAGIFQASENYSGLFIFATVGNLVAIVLTALNWKTLADISTPLMSATPKQFRLRVLGGAVIVAAIVPTVWTMLQNPVSTGAILKGISALVFGVIAYLALRHPDKREQKNMFAYLILAAGSLVFWALYQMAPNGLQIFAEHNVDRMMMGVEIQPQWIQNINTLVIVFGGPLMAAWFVRLRARGWRIDIPKQFAAAVLLMGVGFLCLPLGIKLADPVTGKSAFVWLFLSYVFQSVGELLISPIGYAMIGRLAPRQYQGSMMGAWMLVTGLASLFSGDFSSSVPDPGKGTPLVTNEGYATLFTQLGLGSVAVGVVLVLLVPFLIRLIKDAPTAPAQVDGADKAVTA